MTARPLARVALLLAGLTLGPAHTFAGEAQAQAMIEDSLADFAPPRITPPGWSVLGRDGVLAAVCAPREGSVLRVALTTRTLSRWQRDACVASAAAGLSDRLLGRRVLLAFGGQAPPRLSSVLLYRALARLVPGGNSDLVANPAASWHDLDPALPDMPIRVLVPPAGTAEARILAELVLFDGCLSVALPLLPRPPVERLAVCSDLRADAAVARAGPGQHVASWLRDAGPSAVALVGLDAVAAEPDLATPLPLDGVVPRFASFADRSYRAMLPVHLLVAQAGVPAAAAAAVSALTAESFIGPDGALARRGLAALPATERVRLRGE